jgi:hypothetical protein
MKLLLLAASIALGAGAAHAQNASVPANSPYAIMESGAGYGPRYAAQEPSYGGERRPWLHRRRHALRAPNYIHDTAPPPGLMFDQPSTIGGYPIGY